MSFDFSTAKVLLTGATRGIGLATTHLLLEEGAEVLAVARDPSALAQLQALDPARIDILAADIADPDMPRAIANWVADQHPDCNALINNAAIMVHTRLTEGSPHRMEEVTREIAVNLTGPIALAAAMLPLLARQSGGALLANVTSGLALAPLPNAATYCATKAGLRSFTKALRYQVEDVGYAIQVSEVLMTLVDTGLSQGPVEKKISAEQAAREMLQGLREGRHEVDIDKVRLLRRLLRLSPALAERVIRARAPRPQPA